MGFISCCYSSSVSNLHAKVRRKNSTGTCFKRVLHVDFLFQCRYTRVSGFATMGLGYLFAMLCTLNDLSGSNSGSNLYLDTAFELGPSKKVNYYVCSRLSLEDFD
jgi:hypothetical protein